jgi:FHA domain
MVKCPKCSFDNQEGALFCEQCREDLGGVVMEAVAVEAVAVEDDVVAVAEAVVVAEPVAAAVVETPAAAAPAPAAAAAPAPTGSSVPAGSKPKLVVVRGQKLNVEFPIYGDMNFLGRADEKPVDIDLEEQEPPDRIHSSRQHAVIHFDEAAGNLTIEDLNSANGTYVNRTRIYPGQKKQLFVNDVVQIGNVHLKVQV